jgi:hypothetical protein
VSGATSVDGGQLSNFAVALVDRSDGWRSSRGSGIRAAKLIVRIAGIRLLSFVGVLRDGLGRYGDRFVSTVVVGSGLLMARWSGRNQPSRMTAVFMMSPAASWLMTGLMPRGP